MPIFLGNYILRMLLRSCLILYLRRPCVRLRVMITSECITKRSDDLILHSSPVICFDQCRSIDSGKFCVFFMAQNANKTWNSEVSPKPSVPVRCSCTHKTFMNDVRGVWCQFQFLLPISHLCCAYFGSLPSDIQTETCEMCLIITPSTPSIP